MVYTLRRGGFQVQCAFPMTTRRRSTVKDISVHEDGRRIICFELADVDDRNVNSSINKLGTKLLVP